MKEIFKKIPGHNTLEVSNLGNLRKKGVPHVLEKDSVGKIKVSVIRNGARTKVLLPRIVAELFLDNPSPESHTHVMISDPSDNTPRVDNLEWVRRADVNRKISPKWLKEKIKRDASVPLHKRDSRNLSFMGYPHYWVTRKGEVFTYPEHVRKKVATCVHRRGYIQVPLAGLSGIRKHVYVHRLVAMAFCKCPGDNWAAYEVNHKNGDVTKNWDTELEWTTTSENLKHSWDHLRTRKVSKGDVLEICHLLRDGLSIKTIANRFSVNQDVIYRIYCRDNHTDVSKSFTWPS